MTNTHTRSTAMTQGRRADSARRRQRVLKALNDATNEGAEISVSGIARRAGVDRSFFYQHRDLLEQIHAAEAQPPTAAGVGPAVSRASLQADLTTAHQRAVRLAVLDHEYPRSELVLELRGHRCVDRRARPADDVWAVRSDRCGQFVERRRDT